MKEYPKYLLFVGIIFLGTNEVLAVLDTQVKGQQEDDNIGGDHNKEWQPEVTFHILRLVEQLHTKLTTWEDKLVGLEKMVASVEKRMEEKGELYVNRLENKFWEKLESMRSSMVETIVTGFRYELIHNKDRIKQDLTDGLDEIRQVFLSDEQRALSRFENISKHLEKTINISSSALVKSGLNMTSSLAREMDSIQNSFVEESHKSLFSFQNLTADLTNAVNTASSSLASVSHDIDLSVERSEKKLLDLAESVEGQIANTSTKLSTLATNGILSLTEALHVVFNNLSDVNNLPSAPCSGLQDLKHVLDSLRGPSCQKNMISFPVISDKYIILSNEQEINGTPILCDAITDNGGWIVLQRRLNYDESFYRDWESYKHGFGSLTGDFWLGLENIYKLTAGAKYELRIDLKFNGTSAYAKYSGFAVGDESENYKLTLGEYSGTAGDSMSSDTGMSFSTHDNDNDNDMGRNCAFILHGGWWYRSCSFANLNGRREMKRYYGTKWNEFTGGDSVTYSEMMIRKV